jgi:ubiquinol-cytochrome c reductase iron-sulfur subunit
VIREDGTPVLASDVNLGGILTVFPENAPGAADSQALLIHVEPTSFRILPGREGWAPNGLVAYSKICTHAGCPVSLYEQETSRILCPCHQSQFDVTQGAKPVFGPATRSLPQLPITVDDEGYFVARHDYIEAVGPTYWNRERI